MIDLWMTGRTKPVVMLLGMIFLLPFSVLPDHKIQVIMNPKPTHVETTYSRLERVKTITADLDEENFLARPGSLAVDNTGFLYVFDMLLHKVFQFDRSFNLVRVFGSKGRGPGETAGRLVGVPIIRCSINGGLYMADPGNKKIIKFNSRGKVVDEIRLSYRETFLPVVDAHGNYYIFSMNNGAIDVFDKELNLTATFLGKKDYLLFPDFKPIKTTLENIGLGSGKHSRDIPLLPAISNTLYDISGKDRLIVHQKISAMIYIFENFKLMRSFKLWPKRAMYNRKKRLALYEDFDKKHARGGQSFSSVFANLFTDGDDESIFYLQAHSDMEKERTPIYKFNLDGRLLKVLYIEFKDTAGFVMFDAKKHNRFYGRGAEDIFVFKEAKK